MRNEGAMLSDPGVREGYVQGSLARGMEAAGKNEGGAMSGFMGVGMGMNANGNYFAQASQTNQQQMQEKQNQQNAQGATDTWTCPQCGECSEIVDLSNGIPKFCPHCGKPFQGVPL